MPQEPGVDPFAPTKEEKKKKKGKKAKKEAEEMKPNESLLVSDIFTDSER